MNLGTIKDFLETIAYGIAIVLGIKEILNWLRKRK